jgi:hypothetical protein
MEIRTAPLQYVPPLTERSQDSNDSTTTTQIGCAPPSYVMTAAIRGGGILGDVGGVIEDSEPEEGSGFISAVVRWEPQVVAPAALDMDCFEERLRLMGIEAGLVEGAGRRLRVDPGDGYTGLPQQSRQLDPPPEPPTCNCGSILVKPGWQGRATVRCDQCGSRWGIQVDVDTESMWALSGPSDEWLLANPFQERVGFEAYQPEDVLEQGLPPMPAGIEPDGSFPVASFRDESFGAVLYGYRNEADELASPEEEYEPEIEYFRRDPVGGWVGLGGGGGGWINPFAPPEDLLQRSVMLPTGVAGMTNGVTQISFVGGLCRDDVASVEVEDSNGLKRYPVDGTRHTFVVGAYGSPALIRCLDRDGGVIVGSREQRIEIRIA